MPPFELDRNVNPFALVEEAMKDKRITNVLIGEVDDE